MSVRFALAVLLLLASIAEARDRAVFVYPRERSILRHVFYTSHQRELRRRAGEKYVVAVHEQIATDEALFAIDVDGATLLVLSAHGDPFSMHFGSRKSRTLDASDRLRLEKFLSRLDPFATIVLQSCHTGRGFAHLVKEAAGPTRRVIAARGEVPWNGLQITSLSPFDATMRCDDGGQSWDCTLRLH
jgi:hypothetical protein